MKKTNLFLIIIAISSILFTSCFYDFLRSKDNQLYNIQSDNTEEFEGVPNAEVLSNLDVPGQAIDVDITGNHAYLTNDLGVLYVIDISDKKKPEIVGKCPGIDSANIVIVDGDYAYVSYTFWDTEDEKDYYTQCGFKIIDIADKENPIVVGDYNTGEKNIKYAYGLFVDGDFAYVDCSVVENNKDYGFVEIVEIKNKKNPEKISSLAIEGSPSAVFVNNGYAYINSNFYDYDGENYKDLSKLIILDLEDKSNPVIEGWCEIPSCAWGIYVVGDYAYISVNFEGPEENEYARSEVIAIDATDKKNPSVVGNCIITGGAWELDWAGGFLYVSTIHGGVFAVDMNNTKKISIADGIKTRGASYDITISGNYGYIANSFEGLIIARLSGESSDNKENYFKDSNNIVENLDPKIIVEITGDRVNGYYMIKNPIYLSAEGSFDPDGDKLEYKWILEGKEELSNNGQAIFFADKPGSYTIDLTVYDGSSSTGESFDIDVAETIFPIENMVEHNFVLETEYVISNNGPVAITELECFMRMPQTYYPFQTINSFNSKNSGSFELLYDNQWNELAHFNLKDQKLEAGEKLSIIMDFNITAYEFDYAEFEDSYIGKIDEDLSNYIKDDLFIDSDNSYIKSISKKLTSNKKSIIKNAENIYNYVTDKLYYDYARATEDNYELLYASQILKRGKGVCADYAILYTALLRAAGIPARLAAGVPVYSILHETDNEIDMGHAWVEIYVRGYGWIPFDITNEQKFLSSNYFLNIITEKGPGYLYENITMDLTSYYYDGFIYNLDGDENPEIEQEFLFRIEGLSLENIKMD